MIKIYLKFLEFLQKQIHVWQANGFHIDCLQMFLIVSSVETNTR